MADRNVVLITADSVRADHCTSPNDTWDTTPNLDRSIDDGVVFENAIAPGPRTLSSVPVSHTGEPFALNGLDMSVYQNRVDKIRTHLSTHDTIAERFRQAGYATLGFTTNPWTSRNTGFDRGFDRFEEFEDGADGFLRRVSSDTRFDTPAKFVDQWVNNKVWFTQWPDYYDEILSAVESADEPYFLWVFLLDTHNPYFPTSDDRIESSTLRMYYSMLRGNSAFNQTEGMSTHRGSLSPRVKAGIERAYRDSVRSVDRFVGELRKDLHETDPVFAFHSDHGEAFGDHGTYGHQPVVYEENVHVPFAVFNVGDSERVRRPVSLEAIPDVLSGYANGEGIVPERWTAEYVFSRTEDSRTVAVRGEEWKHIRSGESEELYHLAEDPGEREDRSEREEGKLAELRGVLDRYLDSLPRVDVREGASANDSTVKDRLDSLGYIG